MAMCSYYTDYQKGVRCKAQATHFLIDEDNKPVPGCCVCLTHGQAVVDEYAEKINEYWSLLPCDEYGRPIYA